MAHIRQYGEQWKCMNHKNLLHKVTSMLPANINGGLSVDRS